MNYRFEPIPGPHIQSSGRYGMQPSRCTADLTDLSDSECQGLSECSFHTFVYGPFVPIFCISVSVCCVSFMPIQYMLYGDLHNLSVLVPFMLMYSRFIVHAVKYSKAFFILFLWHTAHEKIYLISKYQNITRETRPLKRRIYNAHILKSMLIYAYF